MARVDTTRMPPDCLTRREVAIVRAYGDGESVQDIAGTLHVSPKTVENLITAIYRRLRVRHRTDLIRLGFCEGWLRLSAGRNMPNAP